MADTDSKSMASNKSPEGAVIDRGEHISCFEPLTIQTERYRKELVELVNELVSRSKEFRTSLPKYYFIAMSKLVPVVSCYYSNLIEGHDTHPIDIERAIKKDYSDDPEKRNLQLEAEAHIAVQLWIDEGMMSGSPVTISNLQEIHRRFYELMPAELQFVMDPITKEKVSVVPGEIRERDVAVGNHLAVSPGALPEFLRRYEQVYAGLNRSGTILSAAAAHHRLLWIHPFLDGNGRVARLMSYAMLLQAIDTGGIWSIARGLARQQQSYKSHLANCDQPRRGTLDGRGPLSEAALFEFSKFFLTTCIDQVDFMQTLVRPDLLRKRVLAWADDGIERKILPPRTTSVLEALLHAGELPRADVPGILGLSPVAARRVVAALTEQGVVVSESSRAPIQLAFPAKLASDWLPGLFPDKL